jgi:hypothetical protein
MKKTQNGSETNNFIKKLPQPYFYLYYIRSRVMEIIKNGSDSNKNNKDPPQPIFYLYYISLRG